MELRRGTCPGIKSNTVGLVTLQNFGSTAYTAANDISLTLETLNLNNFSSSTLTGSSNVGGNYVFAGNGQLLNNGNGGAITVSTPVVLSTAATGLTVSGSGLANLGVSGIISSNTSLGLPLTFGQATAVSNAGIITLSGINTFAGSVTLASGNLAVGNSSGLGVFGNQFNTLTVNVGNYSQSVTTLNPIQLNADLSITGTTNSGTFGAAGGLGLGVISGNGGLVVRPAGTAVAQTFNVANTYTGSTTVGQVLFAPTASPTNPGTFRLNSAAGSALNISAFNVADGAVFEINKSAGDSLSNRRISATAPVTVTSGFVQVIGNAGLTTQNFGTLNAGGATTLLANASGGAGSAPHRPTPSRRQP